MTPSPLLVTLSGPDRPGITAAITRILADTDTPIKDMAQARLHGLLSLSFLLEADDSSAVLKDLVFAGHQLGLRVDFNVVAGNASCRPAGPTLRPWVVTLIGSTIAAKEIARVSQILAESKINIDSIQQLGDESIRCLEMAVQAPKDLSLTDLRRKLLALASQATAPIDIAIQSEDLARRNKRLIAFDMDSTLIENEIIEELAEITGNGPAVQKITEQAMRGEMAFGDALKERVKLLKGLNKSDTQKVVDRIRITPGAQELIQSARKLGMKAIVISGGFEPITQEIAKRLQLDACVSNRLKWDGDVCTGEVMPPILDAMGKAMALQGFAQSQGIPMEQVIAVGDGANDIPMLELAGLGIAFNAKPLVREKADLSINRRDLSSILFLLGLSRRDWETC